MPPSPPPPEVRHAPLVEVVGWIGTAGLIGAFLANTQGWLSSDGVPYLLANLVGAVGVGVHAWTRRSWPAVAVEALWTVVAVLGLASAWVG
jgi:hypothetical protein